MASEVSFRSIVPWQIYWVDSASKHTNQSSVPHWLLEQLPCKTEGFGLVDRSQFLSPCFITLIEAVFSLASILPLLVIALELASQKRGRATIKGQLASFFALVSPLIRLTAVFIAGLTPSNSEWLIIATGFVAAFLVNSEDSRVKVTTPESLIYWALISLTSLAGFISGVVNRSDAVLYSALLAVTGVGTFYCELTNERTDDGLGYDTSNIFDRISLSFLNPLLWKGAKGQISRDDFPLPPTGVTAFTTYEKLQTALDTYSEKNKYRLILAIFSVVRWKAIAFTVLDVLSELFTYLRPLTLAVFLRSLALYNAGKQPLFPSIYFGILYGFMPVISGALQNLSTLVSGFLYVITRTSLTGLIYRKALSLSPKAREEYDSAKIMSLLNVDTEMIDGVANELPTLISSPIAVVIATWQLYLFIGKAMFAAVPLYLLVVPFSTFVSSSIYSIYPEFMKIRDERTKATSDAFRNVKSLKLYNWEIPFYDRIVNIRVNKELRLSKKMLSMWTAVGSLWSSMGDLTAAVVFISFLYFQQGALTADVVFPCLGLLAYITQPFTRLPMSIAAVGKAMSSQTRINDLLTQEDQGTANYYRLPASSGFVEDSVNVNDATISWNGESEDKSIPLKNLTFKASNGDLLCITGKTGSGKTALLKALCNEMEILSGSVTVKGQLAYCPQEAWLQNKTVKDNILFGNKLDEDFYKLTLEGCELIKDIENLPEGDDTEVGERGISLSGGQKARVALARAIYSRADVVILDDVLSAVDEHVSANLIKKLLSKDGLLSQKTIILATNNIKVLSHASNIIAVDNKAIAEQSTFADILKAKDKSVTYRLVKEFGTGGDIDKMKVEERKAHISRAASSIASSRRASIDEAPPQIDKGQADEETDKGAVSLTIFRRYFQFSGRWALPISLFITVCSVCFTNSLGVWLGALSNKEFTNLNDGGFYITVYVAISLISCFLIYLSQYTFMVHTSLTVSKELHNTMLMNTLRAPMSFFDQTPLGRVINRFTGDIEKLDSMLSYMLYFFVRSSLNTVFCVLAVLIGAPFVLVVLVPLVFIANYYRKIYVPGSRRISRMASAANSPILSHIEESVKGISLVRTYNRFSQFVETYDYRTDYWIEVNFLRVCLRNWLSWRLQLMSCALDLAAIFTLILFVYKSWISVGFVGVVIYNSARVGIMARQVIMAWAELEVSGVSLDRALEYVDRKQEAPAHIEATYPGIAWPATGEVTFDSFSTKYKEDGPDVLKKLSFSVKNQEKIGIVGRTGSGKSTLTLSLFRIIEATDGHINVDAVDTSKIGLSDLRSKLSIIPQDAQVFGGSLRENLDPFTAYDDAKLWHVLEMCHLKDHFTALEGLDTALIEGGENLSRGQAQLICLGRALLNEAKILVLDEATASVDVETDKVVQETIRSQFKDRTIITIAHRLHTIADSDRILVLDKGEIVEFDSPAALLKKKGAFYELSNAGKSDELKE